MRFLTILALLAAPALADDAAEHLAQAKALEAKAEALLEAGKREEALAALTRAADLRAQARKAGKKNSKAKKKSKDAPVRSDNVRAGATSALKQLEDALAAGDMQAAAKAGKAAHGHLSRWAKQLDRRAKITAKAPKRDKIEARIRRLEKQVAELKRMLGEGRPSGAK